MHARQIDLALASGSLSECRRESKGHQSADGCDERSVQRHSYLM
jgi:hypothetical protein